MFIYNAAALAGTAGKQRSGFDLYLNACQGCVRAYISDKALVIKIPFCVKRYIRLRRLLEIIKILELLIRAPSDKLLSVLFGIIRLRKGKRKDLLGLVIIAVIIYVRYAHAYVFGHLYTVAGDKRRKD